ncbi:hypothetical protein C8J57DRAFT_1541291 [Mycena rebaudengoi]|nr:hypothetical protein C8J57DRAFT_1541291 [Mycena rebaudengoi]
MSTPISLFYFMTSTDHQKRERFAAFLRASGQWRSHHRPFSTPIPQKNKPCLACPQQHLLPVISYKFPSISFLAINATLQLRLRDGDDRDIDNELDELPDLIDDDHDWAQDFTPPRAMVSIASIEPKSYISVIYDVGCLYRGFRILAKL